MKMKKNNQNNLRELPALPQGRWFTCALGGGSNADGLKPGSLGAFSTALLQIRGIRVRKPETVESCCQDVRLGNVRREAFGKPSGTLRAGSIYVVLMPESAPTIYFTQVFVQFC